MKVYEMGSTKDACLLVDEDTGSLLVTTPEHAMVHAGKAFRMAIKTTSLAQNATYRIKFAIGAKEVHLKGMSISGGQDMDLVLTTGFSSTAGSPHAVVNSNQKHSETSTVTITKGVTLATDGTEIDREYTGVGNGRGASVNNGADELYLAANTTSGLIVTNNAATAATALIKLFWYEPH